MPKVTERICEVPSCDDLGQHQGKYRIDGSIIRRKYCQPHYDELHKKRTGKSLMESTAINAGFNNINEYVTRHWNYNLLMLRFIYNGDENEPLKCLLFNELLENVDVTNYKTGKVSSLDIIVLHHMLVSEGESVKKSNQEPSTIIRKKNLKKIHDKTLVELITCIPTTPTGHKKIHAVGKNLDLSNYPVDSRPWVLRSKENFELFKKKYFRPKLDYERVIRSLYVDTSSYLNNSSPKDKKIIKEEMKKVERLKKEDEERIAYFFKFNK